MPLFLCWPYLTSFITGHVYFSKIETHILSLFYFGHQTLYGAVFQHGNTRPYAAYYTTQSLTNNNVQIFPCLPCPQISLNPFEYALEELDRCVRGNVNVPANVHELVRALQQALVTIPVQVIHNLIQSMSKRCWAVIDSWGQPPLPPLPNWIVSLSPKILIKLFLGWEEVKIMNFDLNKLQSKIW